MRIYRICKLFVFERTEPEEPSSNATEKPQFNAAHEQLLDLIHLI